MNLHKNIAFSLQTSTELCKGGGTHNRAGRGAALKESKNQILLEKCTIEQDWINILEKHCCVLFQISLLISADPVAAETALIETINELDICRGPGADSDARLESGVVMRSIAWPETRSSTQRLLAQSMLQPGMQLLTTLGRLPRICYRSPNVARLFSRLVRTPAPR